MCLPENKIILAVKAFLVHGNRALLVRRSPSAHYSPGLWEYPGGKIEFGETLQQALEREISEETGLNATVGQLLYATTFFTGISRQVVIITYLAQ
ncbi:MAG: NUDIX domain-containing protein, partial [Oscillospiraceae bacterium]